MRFLKGRTRPPPKSLKLFQVNMPDSTPSRPANMGRNEQRESGKRIEPESRMILS